MGDEGGGGEDAEYHELRKVDERFKEEDLRWDVWNFLLFEWMDAETRTMSGEVYISCRIWPVI